MNRRKFYLAAASVVIGVSSISLLLLEQLPRFAIRDFDLAIASTGIVVLLLVVGIILGAVARGRLGWLGVVSCSIGLLLWGFIAIGELI